MSISPDESKRTKQKPLNKNKMRNLILNNTDIKEYFANNSFDEMLVTTDLKAFNNLENHDDLDWEEVVEFGVKKVVTTPFAHEYSTIDYDKITAVCIRFDNGVHDDTEIVINHNTEVGPFNKN